MKSRPSAFFKDYFTLTKKERAGTIIVILLGVFIYFLPFVFPHEEKKMPDNAFQQELASLKISVDTTSGFRYYRNDENTAGYRSNRYSAANTSTGELFLFDPNTLDVEGWQRLGLKSKTIQTIENFRNKGYVFRQPGDIKKIYGIRSFEAERLMPFVRITAPVTNEKSDIAFKPLSYSPGDRLANAPVPAPRTIDVNTADTTAFIALPGIGSKLAARIINFREKLGGFISVAQVGETYGIPDSTFQKIAARLQCNAPAVQTININAADAAQLRLHPYIKWNVANAIVNYRLQHGNFRSVEDLKNIVIITEELFQKIAPYLTVS